MTYWKSHSLSTEVVSPTGLIFSLHIISKQKKGKSPVASPVIPLHKKVGGRRDSTNFFFFLRGPGGGGQNAFQGRGVGHVCLNLNFRQIFP